MLSISNSLRLIVMGAHAASPNDEEDQADIADLLRTWHKKREEALEIRETLAQQMALDVCEIRKTGICHADVSAAPLRDIRGMS